MHRTQADTTRIEHATRLAAATTPLARGPREPLVHGRPLGSQPHDAARDRLDAEREVDLARWRRAVVALWWLPVAGLVLGAIVGGLYSLRRRHELQGDGADLARPADLAGRRARAELRHEPARRVADRLLGAAFQEQAANAADMRPGGAARPRLGRAGRLGDGRRRVRAAPLISLTVTGAKPANIAAAANTLAQIVVEQTTASYVGTKITTFQATLKNVNDAARIDAATASRSPSRARQAAQHLDPLQQLVIVGQENNAETRPGNLIAQQETLQQQLAFAKQVESAKVIEPAQSVEVVRALALARRSSIGALIGLILGAIVAIAGESRRPPPA